METEFDLYTAWLEIQIELEELERKFFEELRGIRNASENRRETPETDRGRDNYSGQDQA